MALMALTSLTACDYIERRSFDKEREDGLYRAAMEEYCAGKIDSAIDKLREVCARDPANSSARFQLAYLLQDHAKDFLGATCAYREYLAQRPESDKSSLARERLKDCERDLATALADRYGLNAVSDYQKRASEMAEALKKSADKVASLETELETSRRRVATLEDELSRAREIFQAEVKAEEEASAIASTEIKDAKALLDDVAEDEKAKPMLGNVDDAKSLLGDIAEDEKAKPMLAQPADAKAKRDEKRREKASASSIIEVPRLDHPDTYIVQDGDTLYKLAIRFYGRSSAWSRIREANKAIISTDGRIRVGQRLVLPK